MFKSIINKISNRRQNEPLAIQCLWNSDFDYIGLSIELIFKENNSYRKNEIYELEYSKFESREAMVVEANKIANTYIEKYPNIEFYFPSPDESLRDCPDWWLHKSAPKCEDCEIPIIPTDSEHLPKEVCYPCHLKRESNKKIINEDLYNGGVQMFLCKNEKCTKIGYSTYFDSFIISSFIEHIVEKQSNSSAINVIILQKPEILELHDNLINAIDEKLKNYVKPGDNESRKRFVKPQIAEYNGVEYELEVRFNKEHSEVFDLMRSFKENKKALEEDYIYEIYFKKSITYRDDTILRFINYVENEITNIENIKNHYKKNLTEAEVIKTIEKLQKIGCIEITENSITITKLGKNII
ncbi:hypothetical protein [Flavobacterium sp.]|uniref:hypothetical protein n=1 Tax=Flavobacterium sp. TaxID=239 RepID=UPI0031D86639